MELREVVGVGRRWWWLLLLGLVVAGGVAFGWSLGQPAEYRAETTLLINSIGEPGTLGADASRGGQELARTYRELVVTWPVLEPVSQAFGLALDLAEWRDRVEAEAITGTQLLRITAEGSDPQVAADLANAIAERFVAYIGQQQAQPFRTLQAEITSRLDDVEQQITDIETSLDEMGDQPSARAFVELQSTLDALRTTRSQLLDRLRELELDTTTAETHVAVATTALPPPEPSDPGPLFAALLGAFAGLLIAAGVITLIEYLGPRPRSVIS